MVEQMDKTLAASLDFEKEVMKVALSEKMMADKLELLMDHQMAEEMVV